jgi:hypothetical protein
MKKAWPIAALLLAFLLLSQGSQARAEVFALGGGLMAYPLDLRGLKAELSEKGAPSQLLVRIPDFAPLPHLLLRGRLGLPIISWGQLEVGRLALILPFEAGTSLSLDSTAIGFDLLGEVKALSFGFVLGLGTDLIQGRLGLSSTDLGMAGLIDQLGLANRSWSIAAVHGSGELELVLGPLRLYFQGKYLLPLSQTGLGIGLGPWAWEAGLGLMLVI